MSRIDALVRLYRMALTPPPDDGTDRIAAWLTERQTLVERLRGAEPPPIERAIERALLSLILAADRGTYDRFVRKRRELAALMRRPRAYN